MFTALYDLMFTENGFYGTKAEGARAVQAQKKTA